MLPALVLAAGLGTRLDPITRLLAKAAVPVAGRTLIERSLLRLAQQGVQDVVVNLHHHPASITSVIGDGSALGLRVRYSWEPVILGSAGGPRRALPLIDSPRFLIVNGDTLCDLDLTAMIRQHDETRARVTMAVVPNPAPHHYNGVLVDSDHRVTGFVPKGQAEGSWHFIGVQIVHADVFAGLEDGRPEETVAGIYRTMVASETGQVCGYCVDQPFVDVGTPRDYLDAALSLAPDASTNAIENGARISPSARLTRSVVWSGALIGDAAALDNCIVTNVSVPAGFKTRQSILLPSSMIRPGEAADVTGDVALFPIRR